MKHSLTITTVLIILLFFLNTGVNVSNLYAQETGSISGRVTDSGGNGITNVTVYIYDPTGSYVNSSATDTSGDYTVPNLAAGQYKIHYYADNAGNYISEYYNDKKTIDLAELVSLSEGQTLTGMDAQLDTGGIISGRVTDSVGNGLENATMHILDTDNNTISLQGTNADGDYSFSKIPPGRYRVYCNPTNLGNYLWEYYDNKREPELADVLTTAVGQTLSGINFQVEEGSTISGRVTDSSGNGIPDVTVYFYGSSDNYASTCITGATGDYSMSLLPANQYKIYFQADNAGNFLSEYYDNKAARDLADPVTTTEGQSLPGIDAQLETGSSISGRVTDLLGNGLKEIRIEVRDWNGNWITESITDDNGNYSALRLNTGQYIVYFNTQITGDSYVPEYYNNQPNQETATLVPVTAGQVTPGINAQLDAGGFISGRVTDTAGNGIENVTVRAECVSGNYSFYGSTDSNGNYVIQDMETENYRVYFSPPTNSNYVNKWYNNKNTNETADNVPVTAGQTTPNIDTQLEQGGTVSGRVTGESGTGLDNVDVYIYFPAGDYYTSRRTQNGDYSIPGIPAGQWIVHFYAAYTGNYISEYYNDKKTRETADTITITAGQTLPGIDAQLSTGGRISGHVTDTQGNPLKDVQVEVINSQGSRHSGYSTDANGDYLFQQVEAGQYKVYFNTNITGGSYIPEYYNDKPTRTTADSITVTLGQTTPGIDAQLADGGFISGRVTDTQGNGIPNVTVSAQCSSSEYTFSTSTDVNGNYLVKGLKTENYKIAFYPPGNSGYVRKWYNDKYVFETADSVPVTAGQTTPNIDIQLEQGGTVSGRVTDESGNGLGNIYIYIYDLQGNHYTSKRTINGDYSIPGIPAGQWVVYFYANSNSNYFSEYYNDKSSLESADAITVTAGQTLPGIDAQLTQGGSISGRVTDSNGNGIYNVIVDARNIADGNGPTVQTDQNGYYTMQRLRTANYRVYFRTQYAGNYAGEWYNDKSSYNLADNVPVTEGQITPNIDAQLGESGSISGQVTDESGNPLANIYVEVIDSNYNDLNSTLTDSNGNYTVQGLPAGTWKVYFQDFNDPCYFKGEYYNNKPSSSQGDGVIVAVGQTTPGIDAQLTAGGVVTGRVTDASGNGICDVRVYIYYENNTSYGYTGTDNYGEYSVSAFTPGNIKIRFDASRIGNYKDQWYNHKSSCDAADLIPVTALQVTSGIDGQLSEGGIISGRVTGPSGEGVANVAVKAYGPDSSLLRNISTDSNGNYILQGLPGGDCKLWFDTYNNNTYLSEYYNNKATLQDADPITVTEGQTETVDVQLSVLGSISGRVTDNSGNGIPDINVIAYSSTNYWVNSIRTDSTGNYILPGLQTGQYKIYFNSGGTSNYISEYYNNKSSSSSADLIPVTIGLNTPGIDAQLDPGGTVTGLVAGDSGNGIQNAVVYVYYSSTGTVLTGTNTDSSGNYIVQGIPAGSWKLYAAAPYNSNYISEYYNNKTTHSNADSISVTVNQTTPGINFQLALGGSISGRVTDPGGNGMNQVYVDVVNSAGSTIKSSTTDSTGNYTIYAIPAGTWKVYFNPQYSPTYAPEYYNDKKTFQAADSLVITSGQHTPNINAQLSVGGSISGLVTNTSGTGISNVSVYLYDENNVSIKSISTDSNGNYIFNGLNEANYRVYFDPTGAGNYIAEYYNDKTQLAAADLIPVTLGQTTPNIDAQVANGCSVTGRVTNSSGSGVQGVRVYMYDIESRRIRTAITNSTGYYTLLGFTAGSYRLYFETRYVTTGNYAPEYYNDKANLYIADLIPVNTGETVTIDAVLSTGATISGRVTDSNGTGIANVAVGIRFYNPTSASYTQVKSVMTDTGGYYTAQGLAGGPYKVYFDTSSAAGSFQPEWYDNKEDAVSATILTVPADGTVPNINAVLALGGTITGRVTDAETGTGLPDIEVYAFDANGNIKGTYGSSIEDGTYTIKGLPTGNFYVNFISMYYNDAYQTNYNDQWYNGKTTRESADLIGVTVGQTVSGIDAALESDGGIIRGRITDESGAGIPNQPVYVFKEWEDYTWFYGYSDNDGYYQVTGIPSGQYKVLFYTSSPYIDEVYNNKIMKDIHPLAGDWVDVTEGETTDNINAVLSTGSTIAGRVTDTGGKGLQGIKVRFYDAATGDYLARQTIITDYNGNYSFKKAIPGQLKAMFNGFDYSTGILYRTTYYNGKDTLASADAFTVEPNSTTSGIDAVMTTGGGTISGYVKDRNRSGIQGVTVYLYPEQGEHSLLWSTSTAASGYFEFPGLVPGNYKILAACKNVYPLEWYNEKNSHSAATVISATEGGNTQIEIILNNDASLMLTAPNGGETLEAGTAYPITWINTGLFTAVKIEYTVNNGSTWILIAGNAQNTGTYTWTVPSLTSSACRVRISQVGGSLTDTSDSTFAVTYIPNGWKPVPGMQYNMIAYGKAYKGNTAASAGDWLGAFGPGGETDCRGVTQVGTNGDYYITISSNATSGETITFKLWPLPSGPSIDAGETVSFTPDDLMAGLPLHFGPRNLALSLVNGWNWVSFNILPPDTSFNGIFGSIASSIEQVKNQTQTAIYSGGSWIGDLPDMSGINSGMMYKIKTTQDCTLPLDGMALSFNRPISLNTAWNWVAYLPTLSLDVDFALQTVFASLKQVKSQNQSAVKVGDGLIGDLTRLDPSKGYTIKMNTPGTLVYPFGESPASLMSSKPGSLSEAGGTKGVPYKVITGNQYNMASYGNVFFEGTAIDQAGYYLAGLGPNGEPDCRSLSAVNSTDGFYFSTILGDTNGENIDFVLFDSNTGKSYYIVEKVTFQNDSLKPDFNLKARSIKITAPSGGQAFTMGSITNITWNAYEVSNVKIELLKSGRSILNITAGQPAAAGTYAWTIPVRLDAGSDYRIRISSIDPGPTVRDTGNTFTILPVTSLVLNNPVGGEVWQIKKSYPISWASTGINSVKIELYRGAVLNTVIAPSVDAIDGHYNWTIPAAQTLAANYKIKISSLDVGVNLSDISPAFFSIAAFKSPTADFNADGKSDIPWRYYDTAGFNCVWITGNPEPGTPIDDARLHPAAAILDPETTIDKKIVGTGDFNSDGKADILWRNAAAGDNEVWLMNGTTRTSVITIQAVTDLAMEITGTGDFNKDGKVDILWRNKNTGTNSIWIMNGTTRQSTVTLPSLTDLNWTISGTGDFNSDDNVDILWYNKSNGSLLAWYMTGTSRTATESLAPFPNLDWEPFGTGDFNGDGKPDISWRSKTGGRNIIWIMDGTARVSATEITQVTGLNWKAKN